jgi:hypothetical protein
MNHIILAADLYKSAYVDRWGWQSAFHTNFDVELSNNWPLTYRPTPRLLSAWPWWVGSSNFGHQSFIIKIAVCCKPELILKFRKFYKQDKISLKKGAGTLLHVLQVCYSFRQKCSKLGTHTTQGLKNNFYLRCFSISSGPKPRLTDEYFQFFQFFN